MNRIVSALLLVAAIGGPLGSAAAQRREPPKAAKPAPDSDRSWRLLDGGELAQLTDLASLRDLAGLKSLARLGDLAELRNLASLDNWASFKDLASLGDLAGLANLGALADLADLGNMALAGDPDAIGRVRFNRARDRQDRRHDEERRVPPASWNAQDPADSLWRLARRMMADENYNRAASLFGRLVDRYPKSEYAGDALYWQAYSLFQLSQLDDAIAALDRQADEYPKARTRGDAKTLRARIETEQAQSGDAAAARSIADKAKSITRDKGCPSDDDDMRVAALQGLMQMDASSALPILEQVLARRDACSLSLRKQAVFIASQKHEDAATTLLLRVARTDPSNEVRAEAIQWLSQAHSPRAVAALDSIASNSTDEEILDKAIFALSQSHDDRAAQTLRRIAQDEHKPARARSQAIFWYGQGYREPDDLRFLRDLFRRTDNEELRGQILQAISQARKSDGQRWLIDIARDKTIAVESRKNALFWAGQGAGDVAPLISLYDDLRGQEEMQNQLIFVYSQRREGEALDKLMDIASRDPSKELRKQALFWIGQRNDPRARKFLLDLISK